MDRVDRAYFESLLDALNSRDVSAFERLLHPDAEFRSYLASVEGRAYVGVDGVREYFADLADSFEDVRWTLADVESGTNDRYAVTLEFVARGRGSGLEFQRSLTNVFTLVDGLIARNDVYTDRAEALRAAGIGA